MFSGYNEHTVTGFTETIYLTAVLFLQKQEALQKNTLKLKSKLHEIKKIKWIYFVKHCCKDIPNKHNMID